MPPAYPDPSPAGIEPVTVRDCEVIAAEDRSGQKSASPGDQNGFRRTKPRHLAVEGRKSFPQSIGNRGREDIPETGGKRNAGRKARFPDLAPWARRFKKSRSFWAGRGNEPPPQNESSFLHLFWNSIPARGIRLEGKFAGADARHQRADMAHGASYRPNRLIRSLRPVAVVYCIVAGSTI